MSYSKLKVSSQENPCQFIFLLHKVILVLTHKLPAFTIKQQCCKSTCVEDANRLGKPGSAVIIYV